MWIESSSSASNGSSILKSTINNAIQKPENMEIACFPSDSHQYSNTSFRTNKPNDFIESNSSSFQSEFLKLLVITLGMN